MEKIKKTRRLNLYMDVALFNELEQKAKDTFLPIATFTRQLIQQALKNNIIKNNRNA